MASDNPRSFGPGIRVVLGDSALDPASIDELAEDRGVALLRPRSDAHEAVLHQGAADTAALLDEADRLLWLAGAAPAPEIVAAGRADDGDEAVVIRLGADAASAETGHPMGPEALVTTLAEALVALHDLSTAHCPFVAHTAALRAVVDRRVASGMVATTVDGPYAGRSAGELAAIFDDLMAELGEPDQPVFVHGSLTAERIWLDPSGGATLLGWQWSGIGDRHVDLAAAATLLARLHGPALVAPFLEAYGLDRVDVRRIDAHQILAHLLI